MLRPDTIAGVRPSLYTIERKGGIMDVQSLHRAALRDSHLVSVVLGDPGLCPACILEFFIRFRCGWDVQAWRAIREMQGEYELVLVRSTGAFRLPKLNGEEHNGIPRLRYNEAKRIAQLYQSGVREFGPQHAPVAPVAPAQPQPKPQPEATVETVVAEPAADAVPTTAPEEPPKAAPGSALLELARTDPDVAALLHELAKGLFFDDLFGGRRRKKPRERPRE